MNTDDILQPLVYATFFLVSGVIALMLFTGVLP
jgi:hypothetical protein